MRKTFLSPALRRFALLAPALVLAVGGCEENRATTFEPFGALGFNFGLQASANGLPSGSATMSGASVILQLNNLRALQNGNVYEVWGYNVSATGADVWVPLQGGITEFRLTAICASGAGCPAHDTTRDATDHPLYAQTGTVLSAAGSSTYAGSDSTREPVFAILWTLSVANGSPANPVTAYHAIVVSVESGTAATTPSAARFLYRRLQPFAPSNNSTVGLQFGHFGGYDPVNAISSPRDYAFVPSGTGAATIRGTEIVANLVGLSRPPIGFYYRAVLQDSVGGEVFVDTVRSAFNAQASLNRISLADADFNSSLPTVSPFEIKAASIRNCTSASTEIGCLNTLGLDPTQMFGPMSTLLVTLEPKAAGSNVLPGLLVGHGVALLGLVPDPAKKH